MQNQCKRNLHVLWTRNGKPLSTNAGFCFHVSGEKPFECPECGRRFARSTDLKVHLPVHSEDKPYKCGECEKMFTRFSTLKEHIRTHTGTWRSIFQESTFFITSRYERSLMLYSWERKSVCRQESNLPYNNLRGVC